MEVEGGRYRSYPISDEIEVEVLFFEEAVHEGNELDDELVLAEVIARLIDH